jgi:hypothetical protein
MPEDNLTRYYDILLLPPLIPIRINLSQSHPRSFLPSYIFYYV